MNGNPALRTSFVVAERAQAVLLVILRETPELSEGFGPLNLPIITIHAHITGCTKVCTQMIGATLSFFSWW